MCRFDEKLLRQARYLGYSADNNRLNLGNCNCGDGIPLPNHAIVSFVLLNSILNILALSKELMVHSVALVAACKLAF